MSAKNELSPTHPLNKLAGVVSRIPLTDALFYFSVALHQNHSKDDGASLLVQNMLILMEARLNGMSPNPEKPPNPVLKAKSVKKTAKKKSGSSESTELPEIKPEDWDYIAKVHQGILDEERNA
jgi:hypothetical protein